MSAEIELENVHLRFHVKRAKRVSLKEYLINGLFRQATNPAMEVHAIRGVSMRLKEGDRLGIVGHNGAGKSTLLKTMAGVYPPTEGTRRVIGRISSLFDINVGFEIESSGWDNIRFRSYLLGETPKTVNAKMQEIADFSELGRFLEMPMKYYSAGMMVRLAFSVASSMNPEVLLIDEALSAGDMNFQVKAKQRVRDLIRTARLMVLISHDMNAIRELCTSAVWMEQGQVKLAGTCDEVIDAYQSKMAGGGDSPVGAAA
ncbi:ABC transporter ATP-binding protein [Zavarzinella formosa]|uniref:ABC transporter ATP-binding protein n=1 Tax=Zavarzinella formosa TaxID=360055 RepID=UPI0002EF4007|nr:ABC transporter ATP-binding protein [Zavarzinella formosa]